jgi:hypothetical protein
MGLVSKVFGRLAGNQPYRLCREAGLPITEYDGETTILAFGGDEVTPQRMLFVSPLEDDEITFLDAYVRGTFPQYGLPDHLLLGLMARSKWAGSWKARVEDGGVRFSFRYSALSKGLDAAMMQLLCRTMIREVAEVEGILAANGLL